VAALPAHPDGDQVAPVAAPAPPKLAEPLGAGVYVHVPFCHVRCPYCDFAVRPYRAEEAPILARVVSAEARLRAPSEAPAWGSLYFGGGTPSRLEPADFLALVDGLGDALDFAPGHERSLEANPEDLDDARLAAWREAGVTRLSIGAQSLWDDELTRLGRTHDAAAVTRGVERARYAGFTDLSVDLMYAFPGHTPERFAESLERATRLGLEHVSAYSYTAESGTPMGDAVHKRRVARPDDDAQAAMFDLARDALEGHGYRHYEISNFARAGHETRHHLRYWRRGSYLGLGPSAVSFLAGKRVRAPRGLEAWARSIDAGDAPDGWVVDDARPHALFEAVFLGLRLDEGMRFDDVPAEEADAAQRARWLSAATPLVEQDFLVPTSGGFRIPRAERARTDAIALLWSEAVDRLAAVEAG
jgi:oxygen-independent coproporphyrinogen-3 oxidase